jgi:hypothetical protein
MPDNLTPVPAIPRTREGIPAREEKTHAQAKELGISVIGNVLVFKTVDDYRRVVDNPTEDTSSKLRSAIAGYPEFRSYLQAKRPGGEEVFNDEFFESLLNSDQIVQIGEHVFRVSPGTRKVYVLPAAKKDAYRDLVAEKANPNITEYSIDEDVLERVSGKVSAQMKFGFGWHCCEGGVGSAASQITFSYAGGNVQTLAAFNKYGIYYSLFAEVFPSTGSNQFNFEFDNGYGYIHWHARCGSTADYGTTTAGNANGNAKQRFQSYQGSANLANFFFGYRILRKSTGLPLTGMNVIRKNW